MTAMPMTLDKKRNAGNETSTKGKEPTSVGRDRPNGPPGTRPEKRGASDRPDEAYLRLMADFENYKRRTSMRLAQAKSEGADDLVRKLVPVIADLEKAAAVESHDAQSMRRGVEMVAQKLLDQLKSMGYERITTVGEVLDPRIHEAIARIPTPGSKPGVILSETSPGFVRDGKLVVPAKVVVAGPAGQE